MYLIVILIAIGALLVQVSALETLKSDHFSVEFVISPELEFFTGGEKIVVRYGIYPKVAAYRVLLGGDENNPRTYHFQTYLNDAVWNLVIYYYLGGTWDEQFYDKKAQIDAKYFKVGTEERGIAKITANLTAIIPLCNIRICDFVAIDARCEDCEANALPQVKVKVVNENVFKNDIKLLRVKMYELAEKLKAENLYEDRDFENVSQLINQAENLLLTKKYLESDKKIREANESLKTLTDLVNKKLALKIYSELNSKLLDMQRMLLNSSAMLEKLKGSENYTVLVLKQKECETKFKEFEEQLKSVNLTLLNVGKFSQAIERMKEIEKTLENLKLQIIGFSNTVEDEMKRKSSGFSLPIDSLLNPIHIAIAAVAIVVAVFVGFRFRKRRKWDELR